jgi:hypothetical protein
MISVRNPPRVFVGRSVSRHDEQLIESEVVDYRTRNFDVSIVHWIECPSECCYATLSHD